MGVYCKIESGKLVDGSYLMQAVDTLRQWDSPLDNLENGHFMFEKCTNLTDFRGNLKKLSNGNEMFSECPLNRDSISYIAGSLPNVSSGTIDIGYLRVAEGNGINGLDYNYYPQSGSGSNHVNPQIALMKEKGWSVYTSSNSSSYEILGSSTRDTSEDLVPTSFEVIVYGGEEWNRQQNRNTEVSRVLNGCVIDNDAESMYCYIATDKIVGGESLFINFSSLEKFDSDLSRLMYGHTMFYGCEDLDTFRGDLSSLEFGYLMFPYCVLPSWEIDMPSLIVGDGMFNYCSSLTSFNGSLKNLITTYGLSYEGKGMFSNLEHFKTDSLGSLLGGRNMFGDTCNLDLESVNHIADVIQDIKNIDKNNDELWKGDWLQPAENGKFWLNVHTIANEDRGRIDIGVSDDVNYYDAGVKMIQKGWDVYFNGTKFEIENGYNLTSDEATIPSFESSNWANQNLYLKKVVDGVGFGDLPPMRIETNKVVDGDGFPSTTLQEWDSDLSSLVNGETMFSGAINLVSFKSDLSSLQTQYRMFAQTALTSWDNDLPNLVEGGGMFAECQSLNSFRGDLSKLVDSYSGTNRLCGMFSQSSLVDFEASLKSLKSGYDMFDGCELSDKSIAIIAGGINDISGLDKNNNSDWTYQVFDGTTTQTYTAGRGRMNLGNRQMSSDDPIYRNCVAILQEKGWDVYIGGSLVQPQSRVGDTGYDCTAADASGWNSRVPTLKSVTTEMLGGIGVYFSGQYGSFYVDTQHIENGNDMFSYFTKLERWYGDLDSLVSAYNMFTGCDELTSFRGNLSNLKNGTHMFTGCSSLNEFSVNNLDNLENAYYMFSESALTSWNIDLPRLIWGDGMFHNCEHLTSFEGDLSSLRTTVKAYGIAMFEGYQFNYFKSKLTSLLCGYNMFRNCNLDKESIDYIAKYINDISGLDKNNNADWTYEFSEGTGQIEGGDRGRIDISVAEGVDYRNAVMIMKSKGWTVYLDGTLL